jgi:hypothetical protein
MYISGVAWRRAVREEGCATALFTSDLIERWEIMWDLIKNKDSLNIAPISFSTFRFVWMFVIVHIGLWVGLSILQSLYVCVFGFSSLYNFFVHRLIRVIYLQRR